MEQNPSKVKIFAILFLGVLVQIIISLNLDLGNQADTLPFARQFTNPDWLSTDWYLNLKIGYRNLFNLIFGPLYNNIGFKWTVIIGEVIIAPLFVAIVFSFFDHFKINLLFLPLFIIVCSLQPSIFFDEWMIGDVDTKVFSYLFAISGILQLSRDRFKSGMILLGLSTSFHVLIGAYTSIAALIAFFYSRGGFKNWSICNSIFKNFYLYIFFAINGLLFSYEWLNNRIVDSQNSEIINKLLVRGRLSHHLWPLDFSWTLFIVKMSLILTLIMIALKYTDSMTRKFYIALFAVLLGYLIGGGLFGFLEYESLMKLYIFRVPDTLLPFFSILSFVAILNHLLARSQYRRFLNKVLIVTTVLIFALTVWFRKSEIDVSLAIDSNQKLYNWIQTKTPKDALFLIPPTWKNFYVLSERSQFVSYKHLPQNNKDLWEWVTRMEALGCNLSLPNGSKQLKKYIKRCYNNLEVDNILKIHKTYKINYLISFANFDTKFKKVYEHEDIFIYKLP